MIVAASGSELLAALIGLGILFVTMLGPKVLAYCSAWLQAHTPRQKPAPRRR